MKDTLCYNCGVELTKENRTVEHVPAKNVYEGFDQGFKTNRITVPACFDCNNRYSKIDQEIRDAIAVKGGKLENKEFTGKGVRSILRKKNWKDRAQVDVNGNVVAVDFSYADLRQLHIKNFKALFYKTYGFPLPQDFVIEIFADGDEELIDSAQVVHDYIMLDKQWQVSGHADIFKYILKGLAFDEAQNRTYEPERFDDLQVVAGLLVYHDEIGAIVVAGREDYIGSLRPNNL